jgi:hypothetical protein
MILGTLRDAWCRLKYQDWAPVLGLGLLVRLLLMPITWHNDAVWSPWMAHLVVEGSPNVYQALFDRFGPSVLSPVVWAPYLPLYYYLMAVWTGILDLLRLAHVGTWTFSASGWIIPNFLRAVFLVKLPLLIADLATWGMILSMLKPARRRLFSWLYLFFPAQLWVTFVMGQNDILPALTTVGALWCATRALRSHRLIWSLGTTLFLGLGGSIKTYPLLLILPTALILGQTTVQVLALAATGALPFVIAILPFLGSPPFIEGALFNHEGTALLRITLGSGPQTAPLFLVLYGLLLIYLAFGTYPRTLRTLRLAALATLLPLFIGSPWPFNWMVWLVPLLAWSVVDDELPDMLYMLVGVYFVILLTNWGKPVGGYTLYPLAQPLRYFTPFRELIGRYLDFDRMQNWAFAVFVSTALGTFLLALRVWSPRRKLDSQSGIWVTVGPSLLLAILVVGSMAAGDRGLIVHNQSDASAEPLLLDTHTIVEQRFVMDIGGLHAVDVWIGVPLPTPVTETLELALESDSDLPLSTSLAIADIVPNSMNRLELGHLCAPGVYTVTLRWSGDVPLPVGRSTGDALADGELFVNGVATGQELAFRSVVDADWRSIQQSAISRLLGDWHFTLPWVLVLLCSFVLTLRCHSMQRKGAPRHD